MEQIYKSKMQTIGYDQNVCDIFVNWEDVKDELLIPERKKGSGNGTIHVFLGAADEELRKEFPLYYSSVQNETDATNGAIEIKHYFLSSNIISMLGYVCQYNHEHHYDIAAQVEEILDFIAQSTTTDGMLSTKSLFKLSTGATKLRPYFKQFENNGVFAKIIRKILLPNSAYKISLYKNNNNEYAAFWLIGFDNISDFEADSNIEYFTNTNNSEPTCHQIIYYGAPGTGKSHKIKEQLKGVAKENIFRTTFHPDSDYSTFVGAYKPTRCERPLYGLFGKETVRLRDEADLSEEIITYKFIPQAFLNAYMQAYRKPNENVYLIIEEINRGNCAQIFGDLFQLLDRNENGMSEYTIKADTDLRAFLEDEMGKDSDAIKDGELCLPANLYIYATMNTSDQSLFPIDSAFKRRWDWEYEPIKYKNTEWVIDIQGHQYSWTSFQKEINKRIFEATSSEDKMLGDYFVNPSDSVITEKMLLNKILFYLWNDVCKDGDGDIFKASETEDVSFSELHGNEGKEKLIAMMNYLGIFTISVIEDETSKTLNEENVEDEDGNTSNTKTKDYSKYAINGVGQYGKNRVATECVKEYVRINEQITAYEVLKQWQNIGNIVPHFIESQEDYNARTDNSKRSNEVKCSDKSVYVACNGYGGPEKVTELINKVNAMNWGISITKKE